MRPKDPLIQVGDFVIIKIEVLFIFKIFPAQIKLTVYPKTGKPEN